MFVIKYLIYSSFDIKVSKGWCNKLTVLLMSWFQKINNAVDVNLRVMDKYFSCDALLFSLLYKNLFPMMHGFFLLQCMNFTRCINIFLLQCMTSFPRCMKSLSCKASLFPRCMNIFSCNAWLVLPDAWISSPWCVTFSPAMHECLPVMHDSFPVMHEYLLAMHDIFPAMHDFFLLQWMTLLSDDAWHFFCNAKSFLQCMTFSLQCMNLFLTRHESISRCTCYFSRNAWVSSRDAWQNSFLLMSYLVPNKDSASSSSKLIFCVPLDSDIVSMDIILKMTLEVAIPSQITWPSS